MSVILAFLAVLFAMAGVWLSRQRLLSKPWLETGAPALPPDAGPPARIGIWAFLLVIGALFAIFSSAFVMRAGYADWRPVPLPPVIWGNTLLLFATSALLQAAAQSARDGDARGAGGALIAGGAAAAGFVLGQLVAWRVLALSGHTVTQNPADAFFYMLTGMHGLHVIGGIAALALVGLRHRAGSAGDGIGLCALYWHGLLVIWLALIALFLALPKALIDFCGALLG